MGEHRRPGSEMKKVLIAIAAALLATPLLAPRAAHAQAATITINVPPPPTNLICFGAGANSLTTAGPGFVYFFSSPAPGGQFTYNLGGSSCNGTFLTFSVGGHSGGAFHAYQGLYGGPNSAQFLAITQSLDLASIDVEGPMRFDLDGDADTIGVTGTYFEAEGDTDGVRGELRYEKSWRPFEGNRNRVRLNAVGQALSVDDKSNLNASLSLGMEMPVSNDWSVTPRASIAASSGSDYFGGDGYVGAVSLGSRYRFPQVARGDLVIGNLIAFTAESEDDTQNWILRNGMAYQYPLKQRVFGRQATVRGSYVYTNIEGDDVGIDDYHEIAVNVGVRMREGDLRTGSELLRFGVLVTLADFDYRAVTATIGYRF